MILPQNPDGFETFWGHIEELRKTILKSASVVLCASILAFFFYQKIFSVLTVPLETPDIHHQTLKYERVINTTAHPHEFTLPPDSSLIAADPSINKLSENRYLIPPHAALSFEQAISDSKLVIFSPLEGMMMTFKISFWVGLTASSPIWLYFIFSFIAPALTVKSYRLLAPFITLSVAFMFSGFFFAYFLTLPIANEYLKLFNQGIGINMWSLTNYIDYSIMLLLGNGIAFEGIVIGLFLVHFEKLSAETLINFRRHFFVFAFIIGAILTPPDVLTQLMLAIPLIGFYEIIILYAKLKKHRKNTCLFPLYK